MPFLQTPWSSEFLLLLLFRIANALYVRTYFNPDEYWQSVEVAHQFVFQYGYLTWEWLPQFQLRGYLHPLVFAALFKVLQILQLDTPWNIAYLPRVLQGCFAAVGDYALFHLSTMHFNASTAKWALACHLASWFTFYCSIRTYSNSLETILMLLAMMHWPWGFLGQQTKGRKQKKRLNHEWLLEKRKTTFALLIASTAIIIRPTNIVVWLFLGMSLLLRTKNKLYLLTKQVLPIGLFAMCIMLIVDRMGYGTWSFVPYNFLRFNLIEGKDRLYGEHAWHWYFSQGFPAIIGAFLPNMIHGMILSWRTRRELIYLMFFGITAFSWTAHKEFRFVLPFLPLGIMYAAESLRRLSEGTSSWPVMSAQVQRRCAKWLAAALLVSNVFASVYLSRWHQRGPLEAMDYLSQKIREPGLGDKNNISIHFLTPCHSTPLYSHLHKNVSCWFPDCSPWYFWSIEVV